MKKLIVAALFVLLVMFATFRPSRAQTIGDDLAVALNKHGMDPVTSPIAAAAIEIAIANNQALLDRISADEAAIAALSPQALEGQIVVQAESFDSLVPMPLTNSAIALGGSGIITSWMPAGTTFTYKVNVGVAGNYKVAVRARSSGVGALSVNGQLMSVPSNVTTLLGTQYTYETVAGPILPLTAGVNTITLTIVNGQTNLDFFTLTKQ